MLRASVQQHCFYTHRKVHVADRTFGYYPVLVRAGLVKCHKWITTDRCGTQIIITKSAKSFGKLTIEKKKPISRTTTILTKRTTSGNHHRIEDDKWQIIIIISPHRIALNAHATATARRTGCSVYAGWKVGTQKINILSPLRSDHYATSLMISYLSTFVDSDKNVFKTII